MHKQFFFKQIIPKIIISLDFFSSIIKIQIVFIIVNEVFHNNKQRFD